MVRGLITLAVALCACAAIVFFGPMAAERAVALLGTRFGESAAAIETVYAVIIYGPLILVAIAAARLSGVSPLAMGDKHVALSAAGLLAGAGGVLLATALARLAGVLQPGAGPRGEAGLIVWGSLVVLFAAAAEEVYFRGWLQPALARSFGLPVAILLSSLAFATLHLMGGARSPMTLVNLFLGGLLFGLLAARGGGLAAALAAHFAWNWTETIGFGLDPNPGAGSFGAIADLDLTGAPLWGGSDEGLNAGIGMTVALCALLVPFLIATRHLLWPPTQLSRSAPAE